MEAAKKLMSDAKKAAKVVDEFKASKLEDEAKNAAKKVIDERKASQIDSDLGANDASQTDEEDLGAYDGFPREDEDLNPFAAVLPPAPAAPAAEDVAAVLPPARAAAAGEETDDTDNPFMAVKADENELGLIQLSATRGSAAGKPQDKAKTPAEQRKERRQAHQDEEAMAWWRGHQKERSLAAASAEAEAIEAEAKRAVIEQGLSMEDQEALEE